MVELLRDHLLKLELLDGKCCWTEQEVTEMDRVDHSGGFPGFEVIG